MCKGELTMQIPKGSGLEVIDRVVRNSLKYYSDLYTTSGLNKGSFSLPLTFNPPSLSSLRMPFESLAQGLNKVVSQLTGKTERVDYYSIVNSFLEPGANLVKPQYPINSNEIQFADIDDDGRSELITSYRVSNGIKTMILKRDDVQWYKMAEISNPDAEAIHYRNSSKISTDGRNYLILGLTSKLQGRTLNAYSLEDVNGIKIFSKKYDKLELVPIRGTNGAYRTAIAFWNEQAPGVYDIELQSWNGMELSQLDSTRYLSGRVAPYYIHMLKRDPDNAANWYNLANTFLRSGRVGNAAIAAENGLARNPDNQLKEMFTSLQSRM